MRNRMMFLLALLLCVVGRTAAVDEAPLLARAPTLSRTQIVFAYGGYLWSVPREGGEARQLTTGGHEGLPVFSPDGTWIAFPGAYPRNFPALVPPPAPRHPRPLPRHPRPHTPPRPTPATHTPP